MSTDLEDARQCYYDAGGVDSDGIGDGQMGPRSDACWYWRRAAKLWQTIANHAPMKYSTDPRDIGSQIRCTECGGFHGRGRPHIGIVGGTHPTVLDIIISRAQTLSLSNVTSVTEQTIWEMIGHLAGEVRELKLQFREHRKHG